MRARHATIPRRIRPRAAALVLARIQVKIELADASAALVKYFKKANVLVPRRRFAFNDLHRINALHDAEQPGQNAIFREVLAKLFVAERIALLAEFF